MNVLQDDIDIFQSRAQQKIAELMWKVAEDSYESSVNMMDYDLIEDLMIAISIFSSCDNNLTVKQEEAIIHYMTGEGNLNDHPYFDFTTLSIKYDVSLGGGGSFSGTLSFSQVTGDPLLNNLLNAQFTNIQNQLNNKAALNHQHTEAQISDLNKYTTQQVDTLLAAKANLVHTHSEANITDLDKYSQSEVNTFLSAKANINDGRLGTKPINESGIADLKFQVYRSGNDELVYMTLAELQQAITGSQGNTFGSEFDNTFK